jgi:hypothetical protein
MEDCSLYIYTLMWKNLLKISSLKKYFLVLFYKHWLCDKQLHVTNVLQRTMTSLLLTLISQHNDRLKCGPPLITPFDHCSFSNHVPKIFKSCLYHSSDILSNFSNIRVFYVFLGFLKNTWKYLIQRPIFKPLYFYNVFLKILENTSFSAPSKNTRISYVTTMPRG